MLQTPHSSSELFVLERKSCQLSLRSGATPTVSESRSATLLLWAPWLMSGLLWLTATYMRLMEQNKQPSFFVSKYLANLGGLETFNIYMDAKK